ncbi:type II secretion system F family protein [Cryobacterium sp. 1639]|uniref:type II secretion system F family protein n=1 Tax=Cryobacterium inferilacus TaxID=2866629 RepID=UPI001C730F21|nr:type II secretion system F family protein [Cryobacterium sp. 1639]MBX0300135.1 type II secretion system F family protein [Cryobacterium sp. 1639]
MSALAWGAFFGSVLGLGLWSLVSLTPRLSRPRLANRLAPYLLDVSAEARLFVGRRSVDPIPVLGTMFSPVFDALAQALAGVLGGADVIERRLRQSGSTRSVEAFRSEQLVWGLLGLAGAVLTVFGTPVGRAWPVVVQVATPFLAAAAGVMLRDLQLTRAATARLARMDSELPTILEFLTLSLAAGEGILDALRRVARSTSGELSREFAGVIGDVHAGVSVTEALTDLSRRMRLTSLTRFVDQVVGAMDRGSPLAEVLRAQAQDGREEAKRQLLEAAGKKEVAMMVPLVFLILPMTIVFAIFPGLFVLQTGF